MLLTLCLTLVPAPGPAQVPGLPAIIAEWREASTTAHPAFLSLTPTGNLLVVRNGYLGPGVVELDRQGRKVWEYPSVQAVFAVRLANGNTLIGESGAPGPPFVPRVLEVTPAGKVVWQYRTASRAQAPQFAQRLESGHTLITLPDRVREVNAEGRTVWESPVRFWRAQQATRLANGHTLVVERGVGGGGRVVELDRHGRVFWQYPADPPGAGLRDPVAAVREGEITKIFDLGAGRMLAVGPSSEVLESRSWEGIKLLRPVANQWWAAVGPAGTFFLSVTYTSGRSAILEIEAPQEETGGTEGQG